MRKLWKTGILMGAAIGMCVVSYSQNMQATSINQMDVFVKQDVQSGTCVLASNVMMLRRKAILAGNEQWSSITEAALEPTAWMDGIGVRNSFTYLGYQVEHGLLPEKPQDMLIRLLQAHPEGIVIYDDTHYHAILLTDYTDGSFYGCDPSPYYPNGRVAIDQTSLDINYAHQYWYVSGGEIPNLPTSLQLSTTSLSLSKGQSSTLKAVLLPAGSKDTITWSSDHPDIASVDESGKVSAHQSGTAAIYATSSQGLSAVCQVQVLAPSITSLTVNATAKTLTKGKTYQLKATIQPADAQPSTLTYTSSNPAVAMVSGNGKITAKKAGSATITVRSANGKYAACKITVKNPILAKSVKLNVKSKTLYKGKSYQLKASITPANTSNKKLTYTSSKKSVATISSSGKITAKKAGTTTITVKTSNGKKATCKITVKNPTLAKSIKLNAKSKTIKKGKSYQLKASITPKNTIVKTLKWTSSNKKVAMVSSKGKVSARKKGSATITVKTTNGKKATCKIKVK